jgi:hypothetical protein
VNDFVEECRREWKRLGVPDPVANEMAEELAADLKEAEAEGVPPKEVLGSGALDPRAFAQAWSTERGLIQQPPPRRGRLRRSLIAVATTAFGLIALAGALLVILASPSTPARLTFASAGAAPPPGIMQVALPPSPAGEAWTVMATDVTLVARHVSDSGTNGRKVGWVLLGVGLGGIVLLTMFWIWTRRRADVQVA